MFKIQDTTKSDRDRYLALDGFLYIKFITKYLAHLANLVCFATVCICYEGVDRG